MIFKFSNLKFISNENLMKKLEKKFLMAIRVKIILSENKAAFSKFEVQVP